MFPLQIRPKQKYIKWPYAQAQNNTKMTEYFVQSTKYQMLGKTGVKQ